MRLPLAALAGVLGALVLCPPAVALPSLGVNVAGIPSDEQLAEAEQLGARQVRMFLLWPDAEPRKGAINDNLAARYGAIVRRLAAAGIRPNLVVTMSPSWASGSSEPNAPPRDPADFADFLARFAGRPDLAGHGIAYELWNEEDEAAWWSPRPDAAAYARLVKAAAPALRAADPSAKVVLGPTTGNNYDFIDAVYKAGAKGSFDAVAVHTDTGCLVAGPSEFYRDQGRVGRFSFLGYREVRKTILANGDDVPIWMTEFGWSSTQGPGGGPACERGASAGIKPSGVTAEQQATYLTQAAHCMGEDPYVEVANWFTLRDGSPTPGLDELEHYGLRSTRGAAKPSWDALRTLLTSGDPLSSPCGDFAGPSIVIETPRMGQTYTTNLPIRARARDAGGVARFTFLADGDPIRNFTEDLANDRPVELDWQGAKELSTGLHTIKVVAVDPQGNQQEAAVQVRKVGPEELQAVGPASFGSATGAGAGRGLAVRCARRRVCTVRGRVQSPAHTPLPGRVQVRWQRLSKVRGSKRPRWRTLHKRTRSAGRPFSFRQRLRRAGKWRVTVVYLPPRPLRRAQAPYAYFQVR